MPRGRALAPLTLTDDERETLERWMHRRKTAQALAQRASLVMAAADGLPNQDVAAKLRVTPVDRRQVAPALSVAPSGRLAG